MLDTPHADGSPIPIWFDESGHTGEDLLNGDQPVFVLASTIVARAEAERLIRTHCSGVAAAELKHGSLSSRPRGRRQILSLLEEATRSESFAVSVMHKRFVLVTSMVDWWVEEDVRRRGVDLYDRGGNIALANVIYAVLSTMLPRPLFQQHLLRYQTMMRRRSRETYGRFWQNLRHLCDVADGHVQKVLMFLLAAEAQLGLEHLLRLPPGALRVTYSHLLNHVVHWRDHLDGGLVVVHDWSKALAQEKDVWEAVLTAETLPIEIGHAGRKLKFPLGACRRKVADHGRPAR